MRSLRRATLSLTLAAGLIWPMAATASDVALVVVNAAYRDMTDFEPGRVADTVADALADAGFEVVTIRNATSGVLLSALRRMGRDPDPEGAAVFYFTGYARQLNDRNYILTKNARIDQPFDLLTQGVEVDNILRALATAGGRVQIALIDGAYPSADLDSIAGLERGLAIPAPEGSASVVLGTPPGELLSTYDGSEGLARAFAEAVSAPGSRVPAVLGRFVEAARVETRRRVHVALGPQADLPLIEGGERGDEEVAIRLGLLAQPTRPIQPEPGAAATPEAQGAAPGLTEEAGAGQASLPNEAAVAVPSDAPIDRLAGEAPAAPALGSDGNPTLAINPGAADAPVDNPTDRLVGGEESTSIEEAAVENGDGVSAQPTAPEPADATGTTDAELAELADQATTSGETDEGAVVVPAPADLSQEAADVPTAQNGSAVDLLQGLAQPAPGATPLEPAQTAELGEPAQPITDTAEAALEAGLDDPADPAGATQERLPADGNEDESRIRAGFVPAPQPDAPSEPDAAEPAEIADAGVEDGTDLTEGTVVASLAPDDAQPEAPETAAAEPEIDVRTLSGEEFEELLSDEERREIQVALQRLGLYVLAIDGIFGSGTRAGISNFQRLRGFEITGFLTAAERDVLLEVAGQ